MSIASALACPPSLRSRRHVLPREAPAALWWSRFRPLLLRPPRVKAWIRYFGIGWKLFLQTRGTTWTSPVQCRIACAIKDWSGDQGAVNVIKGCPRSPSGDYQNAPAGSRHSFQGSRVLPRAAPKTGQSFPRTGVGGRPIPLSSRQPHHSDSHSPGPRFRSAR